MHWLTMGVAPMGHWSHKHSLSLYTRCSFVDLTFYVSYTISSVVIARSLNQNSFCVVLASMNFPRSSIFHCTVLPCTRTEPLVFIEYGRFRFYKYHQLYVCVHLCVLIMTKYLVDKILIHTCLLAAVPVDVE